MNYRVFSISMLACLSLWAAQAQAIPVVTVNLGVPSVTPTSAQIDVSISFDADDSGPVNPDAGLTFIQLSLGAGTSANVSGGDGALFTFTRSSALTNWNDFVDDLFPDGLAGAVAFALNTGTFPGSALFDGSNVLIGTLSVNLAGVAAGETVIIDLLGPDTSFFAKDPVNGNNGEEDVVSDLDGRIAGGVVTFEAQGPVQGAIPEPATFALGMIGLAGLATRRVRCLS